MRPFSLMLMLPVVLMALPALAEEDYQPYVPGGEQVSAPLFVVIAYSLIWLVLVGFVVSVWRRQRRLENELQQLQRQLGGGGQ